MRSLSPLRTLLSLFACSLVTMSTYGQTPAAGTADTTFSSDGQAIATLPGYTSSAQALAVLPDDSVIVAGHSWAGGAGYKMVLAKFKSNGDLDTEFGSNGYALYSPLPANNYTIRAVKVLSTGRILVAGDYGTSVFVARFLSNGQIDSSFSFNSYSFTFAPTVTGMALQSDGKIVVSADLYRSSGDTDGVILRFSSGGTHESSFANSVGYYIFSGAGLQTARCVCLQADGKILYGGTSSGINHYIGRLTTAGIADTTWGTSNGRMVVSASSVGTESVEALTLDNNGNIMVLVANAATGEANDVVLTRRSSNGAVDATFSEDGFLVTTLGGSESQPTDLLIQADGRILVVGRQPSGVLTAQVKLRRFEWNGDVDTTWGTDGLSAHTVGTGAALVVEAALDSAQRVVIASQATEGSFLQGLAALRLNPGAPVPELALTITQSPQSQSVNVGSSVTLDVTVDHAGILPVIYSWYKNGTTLLSRGSQSSYTFNSVTTSNEGSYHVEVSNGQGKKISNTATLTVRQPPNLSSFPQGEVGLLQNSSSSLTVVVTGRQPFTYRWYRDNELVSTQGPMYFSYSNYSFTNVTPSIEGSYHVVISNSDGEQTSETATVKVLPDPSVAGEQDVLITLGEPIFLSPTFLTRYEYRLSWTKNGKAIKSQTPSEASFYISEASLADAGNYKAIIKTLVGSAESDPMQVAIVNPRAKTWVASKGKKFSLSIPTAGSGLTFQWFKGSTPVTGLKAGTPQLDFTTAEEVDADNYTCQIWLGEKTLITEVQTLKVVDSVPTLDELSLPDAYIGVAYEWPLPLPETASGLEVKGLPAGLSFSQETQAISGVPTKVGTAQVSITAINPIGRSTTIKTNLNVMPLRDGISGRFYGPLNTGEAEGMIDIQITASGAYTGKLSLSKMYGQVIKSSFKGQLTTSVPTGEEPNAYTGTSELSLKGYYAKTGLATIRISVTPEALSGDMDIPYDSDGYLETDSASFYTLHCPWQKSSPLGAAHLGVFNINMPRSYYGSMPEGTGYARVTTTAAGILSQTGKLADGTSFTTSGPVTKDFTSYGITFLYKNLGRYSYDFQLLPGTSGPEYLNASVAGSFRWRKNFLSFKGQKNYPLSFDGQQSITGGGKYLKPTHPELGGLMMNLVEAPLNVYIDGPYGSTTATLTSSHTIRFDPSEEVNPAGMRSVKFSAATGLFSGSGKFIEYNEYYDEETGEPYYKPLVRSHTCEGLVIREPDSLGSSAGGFSLLDEWQYFDELEKTIKLKVSYPVSIYSNH
ncbi:delta-60 repeat domain-containing protein [Prosthecobacter debontii]|uniref:Delta-60 repeat domain-containing protein n=1 Tax=Prosthecobacter debontii TaxID=48467 RepID=A0A1T4YLR6_9BACT|nr:immunoglobulin domain-containing protein [Prosthecobacter debontii]SKB02215.1 delta-60 repeat domain-containing protein [Prosthecobacter debontii]